MSGNIKRVINVSTDEVYGESSLGAEKGMYHFQTYYDCCTFTLPVICFLQCSNIPKMYTHAVKHSVAACLMGSVASSPSQACVVVATWVCGVNSNALTYPHCIALSSSHMGCLAYYPIMIVCGCGHYMHLS